MAKKNKQSIWIILGIIGLILFFGKDFFIGATFITCESTEPITFAEYEPALLEVNGLIEYDGTFHLRVNETLFEYPQSSTITDFGSFKLINLGQVSCPSFLHKFLEVDPEAVMIDFGNKDVVLIQGAYYWCNANANILLKANDVQTLSGYNSNFEVCETFETLADLTIASETECIVNDGIWADNKCECDDGTVLEKGDVCPEPVATTAAATTTTATVATTTTTFTESAAAETQEPPPEETKINRNRSIMILILLVAVILAYYFILERGPTKGFFRKKSK